MRAMILAAGYGTRLWPLTVDRTKPAIPFLGRPLVGYIAEYLSSFGCREVVVNLHHQPESVRAALGDGSRFGVHLEYVEEETILGTSGALDNARHLLEGETFFVINGKNYRVDPFTTMELPNHPAGMFTYEVISGTYGLRGRNTPLLEAGKTYTITVR